MKLLGWFAPRAKGDAPKIELSLEPSAGRTPAADFHDPSFEAAAKSAKSAAPAKGAGAGQIPSPPPPKVKAGATALPPFLRTANPDPTALLQRGDRNLATTNIENYRSNGDSRKVMRDFVRASPDLSAAVSAYLRTAITSDYTAYAKNMDGTFNPEATALLQQILVRFDVLGNYQDGFSGIGSMRSNSEQLGFELLAYGSCACELVLDKARLPWKLQPLSVTQIEFTTDGEGRIPRQRVAGVLTPLDIPTFFYVSLDQDLLEPYASSPLEAAIQPVIFSAEFMNDLRRVVKRAIHPRLNIEIVEKQFKENLPADAAHDPEIMRTYMDQFLTTLTAQINGLTPEEALVHFDSVKPSLLNNGNISLEAEYTALGNMVDSKVSTGAKVMPSTLGHGSGSQNVASTEALLFTKGAEGIVKAKIEEIYARALTLAVRLFGYDVYAEFRYADIDLRPKSELEAFNTMKQSRILEQLSYGFITDEQASIELTGQLPPPNFKPLSGTQFLTPVVADPNANPHSTTGASGDAANQGPKSNAPKRAKS